jgi:hypothetical protein
MAQTNQHETLPFGKVAELLVEKGEEIQGTLKPCIYVCFTPSVPLYLTFYIQPS